MRHKKNLLWSGFVQLNGFRIQVRTYCTTHIFSGGKTYTIESRFQPDDKIEHNRIWRIYECYTRKTYEEKLKELFDQEVQS